MAESKNRTQLQKLFKSGAKPSEADFKDLIDGSLNIADDGIAKPAGADTPLKISTHGKQENVLDIYTKDTRTWRLNQKPTSDVRGLNLETGGDSKLFIESSTGNLGLGITKPIAKLHLQQSGGQNALRIDDEVSDTTPLIIDADGKVGIGTDNPKAKLEVAGDTKITGALKISKTDSDFVDFDLRHSQMGQLQFIGWSSGWNINSLKDGNHLYLNRDSGENSNTYIGRLGKELVVRGSDGNVSIGTGAENNYKLKVNGDTKVTGSSFLQGVMTGAANDYMKAQFNLSGGGTVTWEGKGGRLKWSKRFIAMTMGKNTSFLNGHINIKQPVKDIPAANVHDGKARSANAEGVLLKKWEALYAVHKVGSNENAVSFRIKFYFENFEAPSNWILVGVVNDDDNTIKLGNGIVLGAKTSSTNGSPIPTGVIMMWHGAEDAVPNGWAICNGNNNETPDLRNRFIVGAGEDYTIGAKGGEKEVRLTIAQMPSHNHNNDDYRYLLRQESDGKHTIGRTNDTTKGEPDLVHSKPIENTGGNGSHENRPPYYALCYIMKL